MNPNRIAGMVLLLALTAPATSMAANTVLSDVFDGSENKTDPLPGSCEGKVQLGYQDVGTFQVSADGTYMLFDAFNINGADVTALVYGGAFDPANPENNLLTPNGVDTYGFVELFAGTDYRLVVQQWCENSEGAWAVTFSGPGNVTSSVVRNVPDFTEGLFGNDDPRATTQCATDAQYHESEPVQVSTTGTYYYTDILIESDVDVCLQIYSAPFDPNNPNANRVAPNSASDFLLLDDFGSIDLEAGKDYYFVTQPLGSAILGSGEYFYVFAPPAPFRISKALAGGWFNSQTNGQGMFIDVYDDRNLMFLGWYTFDLSRPVDGTAELGEPGHRWLTGFGALDGATANLDVYLAQGGVFDAADPPIGDQTVVGSMTVEFTDCMTGMVDYSLTTPVVSGQIPLGPLADSHVALCESLVNVPGMPGPL